MRAILIAEKPSLMREIEKVYNNHKNVFTDQIDFVSQVGHLIRLKKPDEIDPKYKKWDAANVPYNVPFEYTPIETSVSVLNNIKSALKNNYDYIIHAGDADAEGELLVRETLDYLGNQLPVKRFWNNSMTEADILSALTNLKDISNYDGYFEQALTRQRLDYQFGMNLTVLSTVKFDDLYKLGRVKAPIIKIIVDREREIENYKETKKYKKAFEYKNFEFVCEDEYATPNFQLPTQATVSSVKTTTKTQKAPKLFTLSTCQQEAHKLFKISSSKTLDIIQSLYEKKYVTYPRTDCAYIGTKTDVQSILKSHGITPTKSISSVLSDTTYANDVQVNKESHTAIIPTNVKAVGLTGNEKDVYDLICRRFYSIFAHDKKTETLTVKAVADNDEYVSANTYDIDMGWSAVYTPSAKPRAKVNNIFSDAMLLKPIKSYPKEIVSKPPVRYNDGSLLKALDYEKDGIDIDGKTIRFKIGTPATRANIIEGCIQNGYFKREKDCFVPTDKAKFIVDKLGKLSVFTPAETARWESGFELIRDRQINKVYDDIMSKLYTDLQTIKNMPNEHSKEKGETCPLCQTGVIKMGKTKKNYYCSNYNNGCDFLIWTQFMGANITAKDAVNLVSGKAISKNVTSKSNKSWKQSIQWNRQSKSFVFV